MTLTAFLLKYNTRFFFVFFFWTRCPNGKIIAKNSYWISEVQSSLYQVVDFVDCREPHEMLHAHGVVTLDHYKQMHVRTSTHTCTQLLTLVAMHTCTLTSYTLFNVGGLQKTAGTQPHFTYPPTLYLPARTLPTRPHFTYPPTLYLPAHTLPTRPHLTYLLTDTH